MAGRALALYPDSHPTLQVDLPINAKRVFV